LNLAELIDKGYLKKDCSDLRFTAQDGTTEIPYYVESCGKFNGKILFVLYDGISHYAYNHNDMVNDYKYWSIKRYSLTNEIYATSYGCNYCNSYYITWMYVKTPGLWCFAIDSDDASELEIDGTVVASWYGPHGFCNCYDHSGCINLSKGWHKVIVRQEEEGGAEGVKVFFREPGSSIWKVFNSYNLEPFAELSASYYDNINTQDFIINGYDLNDVVIENIVWVKVPKICPDCNIYMYYGNSNAISKSNPNDVFEFYDDFTQNPNHSDKWDIYRYSNDPNNECYWEFGKFYLTKASNGKGCFAFMNVETPIGFRLEFEYLSGGGSGADGIVFGFFKDKDIYAQKGRCSAGGSLAISACDSSTCYVSKGYYVEFDNYRNTGWDPSANHIAIVENYSNSSLCPTNHLQVINTNKTEDNKWHKAEIIFDYNSKKLTIYLDNEFITSYIFSSINTDYSGIGFGAGTGGLNNNHIIRDIKLAKYVYPEPNYEIE